MLDHKPHIIKLTGIWSDNELNNEPIFNWDWFVKSNSGVIVKWWILMFYQIIKLLTSIFCVDIWSLSVRVFHNQRLQESVFIMPLYCYNMTLTKYLNNPTIIIILSNTIYWHSFLEKSQRVLSDWFQRKPPASLLKNYINTRSIIR